MSALRCLAAPSPCSSDGKRIPDRHQPKRREPGARTGTSTTDPRAGIGIGQTGDPMFTLQAGKQHGIGTASRVRRLTPRECERLQGFPNDFTLVPLPLRKRQSRVRWAADGPRYKAIGNSMAVPVVGWIFRRIDHVRTALR